MIRFFLCRVVETSSAMSVRQDWYIQSHRGMAHPKKRLYAQWVADQLEVSLEHFLDIVRKRKIAKVARMFRRRSRRRTIEKGGYKIGPRVKQHQAYSGEGEFDVLLRIAGLSTAGFAEVSGMGKSTIRQWFGHPMYSWPCNFLRTYIWAQRMAQVLEARGIDPGQYRVGELEMEPMNAGRYPRTEEQARALLSRSG